MEFNKEKFKALWNDITDKASAAAKTAAKKTGEVAESAKLVITLKTEQSKLNGLFTELGKLYYDVNKGEESAEKLDAQIMLIDEQNALIAEIQAQIAENNGKMHCASCGKEIDIEAAFCSACGAKQEPKAEPAAKEPEVKEDAPKADAKPLNNAEFVDFFKNTVGKYFTK